MTSDERFTGDKFWFKLARRQEQMFERMDRSLIDINDEPIIGYLGFSIMKNKGFTCLIVERPENPGSFEEVMTISALLRFPYRSGFFYYHVKPLIDEIAKEKVCWINLLVVPGHGLLHPRKFGLACEIANQINIPVVGIARDLIGGIHHVFDEQGIEENGLGKNYTTQGDKSVYISTGGNCDLEQAFSIIIDKISPSGSVKGLVEARQCARKQRKRERNS
ncbi:MAG: endonuclease V [Candidatus Hodarchaeales archaeon]